MAVDVVPDGTDMIGCLFRERECLSNQPTAPLAQRIVEPLDMIRFACQLGDCPVLCRRNDPFVRDVLIGVKHGVLTVCVRNLGPQELGAPAAAIPHMKGNHLATRGIHGDPNPLLVRFLLHEAAHFIRFYLQAPQHDVAVTERTGDAMAASFFGRLLRA